MHLTMSHFAVLVGGWLAWVSSAGAASWPRFDLSEPGLVVVMRHALAPGVGDPPDFDLNDCATQRNLNDAGRTQARAIGDQLRAMKAATPTVYTSAWCRCRETARLLGFGEPRVLDALNSFFEDTSQREPRVKALGEFLRALPTDCGLVLLVTHQVNITALTDRFPASGAGVLLKLNGTAKPIVVGFIDPP